MRVTKIIFVAIGALVLLVVSYLSIRNNLQGEIPKSQDNTTYAEISQAAPQKFIDNYRYEYLIVSDLTKIELYSNLEESLSAKDAKVKYRCQSLISGGFYSKENKHVGLFVINGKKLNPSVVNSTFNGYFYINSDGMALIDTQIPTSAILAIQSGPTLIENSIPSNLNSNTDKARRVVVAVSRKNKVIFLVVYDAQNFLQGPSLADLPKIIQEIGETENLDIESALNLDGGSHSAFLTNSFTLSEIAPIGSYFCIKS